VDATYRSDLREINELNYARFDAKLEQRLAQLEAKIDRLVAELRASQAELKAELKAELEKRLNDHNRSMILMWATLMAAVIGLWTR
jgi:hypothetical protein